MDDIVEFRATGLKLGRRAYLVKVAGELDLYTVSDVKQLVAQLADDVVTVLVDLTSVTFVDSAGLGALVGIARRLRAVGGVAHLVTDNQNILKLLAITGFDRYFVVSGDVDAAVRDVVAESLLASLAEPV